MPAATDAAAAMSVAGVRVPRVGLGTLRLPGVRGGGTARDGVALVRRALDLGVRYIDTAEVFGEAEAIVARGAPVGGGALVATSAGARPLPGGAWTPDGRAASVRASVARSLRRLRRERIDLLFLHRPMAGVPWDEAVEEALRLHAAGDVAAVGLCDVTAAELGDVADRVPVAAVRVRMSALGPDPGDLLAACELRGVAVVPWYPLGCGVLARPGGPLAGLAAAVGATPAQAAVAWLLARSPAVLAAPGTSRAEHVAENVAAARLAGHPRLRRAAAGGDQSSGTTRL